MSPWKQQTCGSANSFWQTLHACPLFSLNFVFEACICQGETGRETTSGETRQRDKQYWLEQHEKCKTCCPTHPHALVPYELCLCQRRLQHCHSFPVQSLSKGSKQELGHKLNRPGIRQKPDGLLCCKDPRVVIEQIHRGPDEGRGVQVYLEQGEKQVLPELRVSALCSPEAEGLGGLRVMTLHKHLKRVRVSAGSAKDNGFLLEQECCFDIL